MIRDAAEIASRYAFSRPGFRLVQAEEVGLPYFWLTLEAIVQERKSLSPVDEFVLLAIRSGLDDPDRVARFLGLEPHLVNRTLVDQIHADTVDWVPSQGDRRVLRLTERGHQVAAELATIEPKQAPLFVAFDRMTWQVSHLRKEDFVRPHELRDAGVRSLPWRRANRPLPAELPVRRVDAALVGRGFQRSDQAVRSEILAITGVPRGERMYRPAMLLVYQEEAATSAAEVEVDIVVDGRRSDEHSRTAAELGVAKPLSLESDRSSTEELPPDLAELRATAADKVETLHQRASIARARLATLEETARSAGVDPSTDRAATVSRQEIIEVENELAALQVRALEVWEHAPILRSALADAKQRLLIISPWIKGAVVDRGFLEALSGALVRGVRVHIGYGIARNAFERQKNDVRAEGELSQLAHQFQNFTFCLLGDTHAKVLVWDDFIVTTSFNWLSYKGDPNLPFRQEEGTLVSSDRYSDEQYRRHSARIEQACAEEGEQEPQSAAEP